ncbi:hypothetical protein JTB14_022537 [Gonioctena quinquepunctata]|nr:hypothetical protein JTB14_022537 [Gonioctena quinquepunctata]
MEELQTLVHSGVFAKLIEGDVISSFSILVHDNSYLKRKTGLTEEEVEGVKKRVALNIFKSKFVTADKMLPWERISTGCKAIDSILRGGIPINGLTEIFGCSGAGKTQFCLQLCLQIQLLNNSSGRERGAVYICTEDVFPSKRLHQLSSAYKEKYNMPQKDFESNIYIDHVADYEQLRRCLSIHLPNLLRTKDIGLIIVDSIAGAFRSENSDVDYTKRGRDLCEIAYTLNKLSDKQKAAVVCINQVSEDVENEKTEPCLGLAWSNNINYRCQISRFNNISTREFEVIFAPDLPCSKTSFVIEKDGICSFED